MITVICPVRNEEAYIENVIRFFLNAQPSNKELFIVDGNSTDKSKEIALKYGVSDMQIHRIKTGENWGHLK